MGYINKYDENHKNGKFNKFGDFAKIYKNGNFRKIMMGNRSKFGISMEVMTLKIRVVRQFHHKIPKSSRKMQFSKNH